MAFEVGCCCPAPQLTPACRSAVQFQLPNHAAVLPKLHRRRPRRVCQDVRLLREIRRLRQKGPPRVTVPGVFAAAHN